MTSSRLIRPDAQNSDYVTWNAPQVEANPGEGMSGLQDAQADIEELHRQAWEKGFAEGRSAGLSAGEQELSETAAALECILNALARPLEELDVCVEEEIVALVKAVSGQLVRRELKIDPSHIVGVIRDGLAALPSSSSKPVIRLHPLDVEIVQQCLSSSDVDRAWHIEADPIMQRGGCMIVTADSQIDCCLETRLARVIATMFEGERANDE